MSAILAHANAFAASGVPVFPCNPATKRPMVARGFKAATVEREAVAGWFARDAMIGIPTGRTSGFWVLDIDAHHGGLETLAQLEAKHGPLPETITVRTPNGGKHLYFRLPENRDAPGCRSGILDGIDVRGEGGYVIAAPSVRADGVPYEYAPGPAVAEYADAPDWLLEMVCPAAKPIAATPTVAHCRDDHGSYVETAITAELAQLRSAPKGQRNDTLNRAAFALATFPADVISDATISAELLPVAQSIGLTAPESAKTIASGIKGGRANPREWPPRDRLQDHGDLWIADALLGQPSTGERLAEHASTAKPRGRMIDLSANEEYSPPEEVIADTIPARGVGFIGGQSGAYKTFLAVEMAVCLMTGEPFAGREIDRQGGVIFVAFEGEDTIKGRIKARRTRMRNPNDDLPILLMAGFGPVAKPEDFAAFGRRIEEFADVLLDRFGAPLAAVIIDTVAASGMIPDDRENDPAAWQRIFDGLNPVSARLDAPVVLVHHYGKSADAGLRGSSNARAGADFVLAMTCSRDEITGESTNHHLALTKSRYAPEGSIAAVSAEVVEIGNRKNGRPVTSLVLHFETGVKITNPRMRKPGKADVAFAAALQEALAEAGERQYVGGQANGAMVRAVKVDEVRLRFSARYVTAEADAKRRADAVRKSFVRALTKAQQDKAAYAASWAGAEWVWTIADIATELA